MPGSNRAEQVHQFQIFLCVDIKVYSKRGQQFAAGHGSFFCPTNILGQTEMKRLVSTFVLSQFPNFTFAKTSTIKMFFVCSDLV